MIIGVSQPAFLPWAGYIALIDRVDEFIFLDDVQFDKRSWQQRNNIKGHSGTQNITIPVYSKNLFHQKIHEVKINYSENFLPKMLKTIEQNYSKSDYFDEFSKDFFDIFLMKHEKLISLNISLIKFICEKIDINTNFSLSSELSIDSSKATLIAEICKKKKTKMYISTSGAKNYLNKDIFFEKTGTELFFYDYLDKEYKQMHGKFVKKLSIIDLLFNEGLKTKKILKENFILEKNK